MRIRSLALGVALLLVFACIETSPVAPRSAEGPVRVYMTGTSEASLILHPVAQGNWISFSANGCSDPFGHWDCVNDQPDNASLGAPTADDGDATMLTVNGRRGWKDSYRLDGTQLPDGATITRIVITARAAEVRAGGPDPVIRLFYDRTGLGANVTCPSGGTQVGGTTYQTVSCTFDGLSLSSLPEIGIEETTGRDLKVTQVYAEVSYQ